MANLIGLRNPPVPLPEAHPRKLFEAREACGDCGFVLMALGFSSEARAKQAVTLGLREHAEKCLVGRR